MIRKNKSKRFETQKIEKHCSSRSQYWHYLLMRLLAFAFMLCLLQVTTALAETSQANTRKELIRVTEGYKAAFPEETLVKLQEMVDQGNPTAMGLLGAIYIDGLETTGIGLNKKTLVEPNPEKGAALCEKGAESDPMGYSQLCYAAALIEGMGVILDYERAKDVYNRLLVQLGADLKPEISTLVEMMIDQIESGAIQNRGNLTAISPFGIKGYGFSNRVRISTIAHSGDDENAINERYIARNELQKIVNKGLSRERQAEIDAVNSSEKDILTAYILFTYPKDDVDVENAFILLRAMSSEAYGRWYNNLFERLDGYYPSYRYDNKRRVEALIQEEKSVNEFLAWKNSAENNSFDALLREMVYIIRLDELNYTNHASPLLLPCDILKKNKDDIIPAFYTPNNLSPLHDRPIFDCPTEQMVQIPEYQKLMREVRIWNVPALFPENEDQFRDVSAGLMSYFKFPILPMFAETAPGKLFDIIKNTEPVELMVPLFIQSGLSQDSRKESRDIVLNAVNALSIYYQKQGFKKDAAEKLAMQIVYATTPSPTGYNGYIGINSKEFLDSIQPKQPASKAQPADDNPYRLERVLYFMKENPELAEKLLKEDIAKRKSPDFEESKYATWSLKKSEVYLALLWAITKPPSENLNQEISVLIAPYEYTGGLEVFADTLATQVSGVTIPCKLAAEHKELIDSTATRYGGYGDLFLPELDCSITDVTPTLDAFLQILDASAGRYYGCSSGSSANSRAKGFQNFLSNALVNPEGFLQRSDHYPKSGYDIPLEKWGLHSLQNFKQYDEQVLPLYKQVKIELAEVFKRLRDLTDDKANEYAEIFLAHAGFRAYWDDQYANYKETKRYKILNRRPLNEIKEAEDGLATYPGTEIYWRGYVGTEEPLLHISVLYPEALEYLIAEDKAFMYNKNMKQCNPDRYDCDKAGVPISFIDTPSVGTGKTALMNAAQSNQLESVRILLKHGASPNIQLNHPLEIAGNGYTKCYLYNISYGKRTALMYAASFASLDVLKALLESGADKTIPDSQGLRAIHYLLGEGPLPKNAVMSAQDFKEAIKLLL